LKKRKIHEIAAEVSSALDELVQLNDPAVAKFLEAFSERSKDPFLDESKGNEGLTGVLASLLWSSIPQSYFNPCGDEESQVIVSLDPAVKEKFRSAIKIIVKRYPHVLISIKKDQEETGRQTVDHLRALFRLYWDNRTCYPY